MAQKPIQKGGRRFEYRNGQDGFAWEGMATKVDPGGNPPNRPRYIGNCRIQGGGIITAPNYGSRGTMVPIIPRFNPSTGNSNNRPPFSVTGFDSWAPHWIGEHNAVGGTRLWWGGYPPLSYEGIPPDWVVTDYGARIGFIDTDFDPPFCNVGDYPANDTWTPSIERFNREVYVGDYSKLKKLQLVQVPAGSDPTFTSAAPADEIISTFPGYRCAVVQEYMGKLYFMLTDPFTSTNGYIYSWDGYVVTQEYAMATPAASGAAAALYKNQLVFTVAGYGSIIYYDPGSGWSTATIGGFDSSPFQNSMAQYRDKLYIMDGVDTIYSWDGSALALAYTISATGLEMGRGGGGNPAIPALAFCCATLNDRLYFGWTDTEETPNQVTIGCFDAKAAASYRWIPNFQLNYEITTLGGYPTEGGDPAITALAQYRGRLWAAIGNYPVGNSLVFTHSAQFAPYDGWFVCDGQNGPSDSFGGVAQGLFPIYFFKAI